MRRLAIRFAAFAMRLDQKICSLLFRKRKRRVVFLSRQADEPSLDYLLLSEELNRRNEVDSCVFVCCRVSSSLKSVVSFAYCLQKSLYYLATSRIAVLDSYWPAVSLVKHDPQRMNVIQIWHALGKIKQSSLQSVGRPGGRSEDVAAELHLHENYDFVISNATYWRRFYCECFGCDYSNLIELSLPRADFLSSPDEAKRIKASVYSRFPSLKDKTVILYAPTFRRTREAGRFDLSGVIEGEAEVVVKCHPNQLFQVKGAFDCPDYSSMELLLVADLLITDYSAIALEAAVADVPTVYYLYDYEEYKKDNGLNIDLPSEMPSCISYDLASLKELVKSFLQGDYPYNEFAAYKEKFTPRNIGRATEDLADFICARMTALR